MKIKTIQSRGWVDLYEWGQKGGYLDGARHVLSWKCQCPTQHEVVSIRVRYDFTSAAKSGKVRPYLPKLWTVAWPPWRLPYVPQSPDDVRRFLTSDFASPVSSPPQLLPPAKLNFGYQLASWGRVTCCDPKIEMGRFCPLDVVSQHAVRRAMLTARSFPARFNTVISEKRVLACQIGKSVCCPAARPQK